VEVIELPSLQLVEYFDFRIRWNGHARRRRQLVRGESPGSVIDEPALDLLAPMAMLQWAMKSRLPVMYGSILWASRMSTHPSPPRSSPPPVRRSL
jgi:hypothetical protein